MADTTKSDAIWIALKKIVSYTQIDKNHETTVFPFFFNYLKNFFADRRKTRGNSWDYQLSFFKLDITQDRQQRISFLVEKYNERLLIYSEDKDNPWVIDDRDKDLIRLHRQKFLAVEKRLAARIKDELEKINSIRVLTKAQLASEEKRLHQLVKLALLKQSYTVNWCEEYLDWEGAEDRFVSLLAKKMDLNAIRRRIKELTKLHKKAARNLTVHYRKGSESLEFYLSISFWEKADNFFIKNKFIQFFSVIWDAVNSHATLFNWINLLLLFFSLSVFSLPSIFLIILGSLLFYLAVRFIFFVKTNNAITFPQLIGVDKIEKMLEYVKMEVVNRETIQKELGFLLKIGNLNAHVELYRDINVLLDQNIIDCGCLSINLFESPIYQYLTKVNPKTQFVAALIINFTNILLYTYLLTSVSATFLSFLGAITLASMLTSPLIMGIIIVCIATVFLIRLLIKTRAKEDYYARTIINLLNAKCEYSYYDSTGEYRSIQLEKWQKFEYLSAEINCLIQNKKNLSAEDIPPSVKELWLMVEKGFYKKNIYNGTDQYLTNAKEGFYVRKIKKIVNRFCVGSAGGFYGFFLAQWTLLQNNLDIKAIFKILSFPLYIVLLIPFVVINAIANLVAYHLSSRQRDRLFFAENLDNKLKILELTKEKLLYLTILLKIKDTNDLDADDSCVAETGLLTSRRIFNQNNRFCLFGATQNDTAPKVLCKCETEESALDRPKAGRVV